MALLIASIETIACECCGSTEHSRGRRTVSYCFHGQEWLLKDGNADKFNSSDGHAVVGERWGWYLRGGRLPICLEHFQEGDVPTTFWELTG